MSGINEKNQAYGKFLRGMCSYGRLIKRCNSLCARRSILPAVF